MGSGSSMLLFLVVALLFLLRFGDGSSHLIERGLLFEIALISSSTISASGPTPTEPLASISILWEK